ncbi:23S ribosomal RNA methyltransferase Erm [Brevibacillus sp. B_LB10_24]|uniref:23S ribosomal RNA methyltransferase Erm n=1 Tax=Brevibacillus sp. B_LB10_24 TaxID=3380645 RepID=UPI0038BAA42D
MQRQDKRRKKGRKLAEEENFSGQHLLRNKRIVQAIIGKASVHSTDTIVDLGAGKGALTFRLAEKAGKVLAIENDPAFAQKLRRMAEGYSNITIIEKDILKARLPVEPFSVVANIPFSITTPILKKLLDPPTSSFQKAILIVEKGAAKRFTAPLMRNPLILKWRMWFDMELVQVVSKYSFSPPPSVESAIFRITRKENAYVTPRHHDTFVGFAEYGLRYPDLPISEVLKGIFTPPQLRHLVKALGVDRHASICTLNELQWGIVFHTMLERVEAFRWPKRRRR